MTATAVVSPGTNLIDRLLNRWFSVPATAAEPTANGAPPRELREDLRAALEAASMCQTSALSAEYAHYLMDRHCGRSGGGG